MVKAQPTQTTRSDTRSRILDIPDISEVEVNSSLGTCRHSASPLHADTRSDMFLAQQRPRGALSKQDGGGGKVLAPCVRVLSDTINLI